MMGILRFEWYRMTHGKLFRISLILALLLSAVAAAQQFSYYLQGMDHISVFYRWIGQQNFTFGSYYLYEMLPMLAALGYSHTLCSDRVQGYGHQIISRVSKRNYYTAKYIVSFVSGGIIFSSAILLNFMILSCFMTVEIPDPASGISGMNAFQFLPALYYSKPYAFMFLWMIVTFLWGGAMAIIGLLAGLFTESPAVSAMIPFLVFISESVIGSYFMQKNIFLMGYYSLQLVWTGLLCASSGCAAPADYTLLTIAVIIGMTTLCYWLRVRKYEYL